MPVPPPKPAKTKTISAPLIDFLSSVKDSFAASLPFEGYPPHPSPLVNSLPIRSFSSAFVIERCNASVFIP